MARNGAESVIACALIPRFTLLAVLEGRRELLLRPMALAPEPGGPQVIGEASGPAEAFVEAGGLRGLYGTVERALRRARDAIGPPVRLGGGRTRLAAYAAAQRSRPRRAPVLVPAAMTRSFLAPLP